MVMIMRIKHLPLLFLSKYLIFYVLGYKQWETERPGFHCGTKRGDKFKSEILYPQDFRKCIRGAVLS